MKVLLMIPMVFSLFIIADGHDEDKPMYEANVAEYYVSSFKEGKDMDDMMKWAEKWTKWATTGDAAEPYADYRSSMLIPYYGVNLDTFDFIWLGINTNPEMQAKGNEYWIQNGGKLLKELPVNNHQVINTWQRTVSETPDGQAGYVVYSDCRYGEGVTGEQQYNAYFAYAQAAQKMGDVAGRKMIWPSMGITPGWDYDYVQAVFTSSVTDYGKNWSNFWSTAEEMPEYEALQNLGGVCENDRSFSTVPVKN
jgi:hypothetical protein|tara:strand:+ start:1932 stop:2684 length:753 start_codon:yes stop_codon:yes gene_type:complete